MATGASPTRKAEPINFGHIRATSSTDVGVFRVMGDLFGWKNPRTGEIIQMEAHKVDEIEWLRVSPRDFSLCFTTKDRDKVDFVGFKESDYDSLASYLKKHWKKPIASGRLGCKGWHWGQYQLKNKRLCFNVDGKRTFEIPFKKLAGVTTSKSDIALEIDTGPLKSSNEDQLVEIKFCVPPPREGDAVEAAELFKATLLDSSGLAGSDNDIICSFPYKQCQMPPGRFDVQYTSAAVKLHGKSSDFTVAFNNVHSVFMLPSNTGAFSHLLLSLLNPLKKGQTKYPAVIIQMDDKKEIELTVNVSDEVMGELKKINPDIRSEMTAIEHQIAGDLLKGLSGKPLIEASGFRGSTDHPCFRCSHKITSGLFYPLQKQFVFIPKPVVIVRFDEIATVDFGRTQGQQTRLFEFQLTLRNGQEIEFSSVDRAELQPFMDFVTEKGLKMRSLTTISKEDRADMEEDDNEEAAIDAEEEDESDDVDFEEDEEEDY